MSFERLASVLDLPTGDGFCNAVSLYSTAIKKLFDLGGVSVIYIDSFYLGEELKWTPFLQNLGVNFTPRIVQNLNGSFQVSDELHQVWTAVEEDQKLNQLFLQEIEPFWTKFRAKNAHSSVAALIQSGQFEYILHLSS